MSRLAPEGAALSSVAESEFPLASRRRRRLTRQRLGHAAAPYALLAPAAVAIGVILGYPMYLLVRMSFEKYGLFELIRHQGRWVGTANYAQIFHDSEFWHVLLRTALFTVVNVTLTMVFGTGIALLLLQVSRWLRVALTTGLVLVWSIPVIVAVDIWRWMVDYEFGVANWSLTAPSRRELHPARLVRESVERLRRDHGADRLGRDPVRHDHDLRSARPGAAGAARGSRDRRCPSLADLSRGDDAAADADLRHPHEPVDHLGLPGLPADLGDARRPADERLLHDGDLRLPPVVPDQRVRARRCDRGRDGAVHVRRDARVPPADAAGAGEVR